MTDFPQPPYKVELLQGAQAEVRRCLTEAQRLDILGDYVAAIRRIYDYLTTIPHTWGEEWRHYRGAKLVLRKMIHDRILVSFAAHEEKPVVFVRECRPVLGHPLESA
ncbi:MAG TPA: hypothetical protein VMS17_13200 [Gemmataceae bacterium]|nr:hypothetical protein [Gemmataceae bacterium]